ncbi:RcnB family protein [Xanthobacter sp. DSM 24535]|uniref:RcnB family protein n=1 Tax=Roseixanthobacter psychrophilus TaxID=3119917 RepID=UPI00372B8EA0
MRNPIAIFAAIMVVAAPLATISSAQAQTPYGQPGYRQPGPPPGAHGNPGPQGNPGYHRAPPKANPYAWRKKGGRMPHGRGYAVNDYRKHGLRQPPRGYHWVRDGNNYILAGITSGIISSILNATR